MDVSLFSTMELQGYCGGGGGDGDHWYDEMVAASLPVFPLCSSSSSTSSLPLMTSSLPIATALPDDDGGALMDCSSALLPREGDMSTGYLPAIAAPVAADDLYGHQLGILPPFPADLTTAGLDDSLLMDPLTFSDIDLEAFSDVVLAIDEPKPELLETHGLVVSGYETTMGYAREQEQPQQARPALLRCVRRSGGDGSAAAAGGRSLDHIGFEELRKYFYMPITKAAREMNVGLTVLKKRCRELGVARWPHRKMKSLRFLIVNIKEMGVPSAAVQRELDSLEMYCDQMEKNPDIELTDQTKKLRQACFKENYKRRRAASVSMMVDRCYNSDFGDDQQQLRLPRPHKISRQSQSTGFFGY